MGAARLSVCLLLATTQCVQCTLVSGGKKKKDLDSLTSTRAAGNLTKGSKKT